MDSTYKTNRYHLPLLEFFSVTTTEKTYLIAFSFMESEKEDIVIWTVEMCRCLLKSFDNLPKVIVTNRDNALMNVIAK